MAQENKTEKATPKRRREQRKEGRVAQSKDVVMVGSLFVVFWGLKIWVPYCFAMVKNYYVLCMEGLTEVGESGQLLSIKLVVAAVSIFFVVALPILILSVVCAILFTGAQTKFLFSKKALAFKLSNLNIISGLKNMFSIKSLAKLAAALIKIVIVTTLLYKNYLKSAEHFAKLMGTDIATSLLFISKEIVRVVLNLSLALIGIAAVDYFYNWWTYEKSIKMTKQEVKDEHKQLEGDPQIKGQIRRRQRQMAQSRMMQMVPKADVVIRNPTHFAVALKYNSGKDFAPKVVAKGVDSLALSIVSVAQENKVPIIENRILARELYAKVKLGKAIPASAFKAVAEILVWVYRMKKDKKEQSK